jgi:cytochrome c peroxidase
MKIRGIFCAIILFITGGTLLLHGCRRTPLPVQKATPLAFTIPAGFPQPFNYFGTAPQTEEMFALGRRLFYDGILSKDGSVSCGSCHQPQVAFTTVSHDRSHGYGGHTLRNAPSLANMAWHPYFTWDGSRRTLDEVIRKHIESPVDMGESIPSVLNKLRSHPDYPQLFREAFGTHELGEGELAGALKFFVLHLVSAGSKYDRAAQNPGLLDASETAGLQVFRQKCSSCHAGALFTDFSFRNTGWPLDPFLKDAGLMTVTGRASDSLKFRVPSLRNLAFTDYYLHDGRQPVFRRVYEHYKNPLPSPTLDPSLAGGIPLSVQEENDLLAFLFTLSDTAFVNNPRFRKP